MYNPKIIHHRIEGLSVPTFQPLSVCFLALLSLYSDTLLISMGAMRCDWLVAAGQSKLLRPALYLAINALSLSLFPSLTPMCFLFPLLPQHSGHLGRERTGKEDSVEG